MMIFDRNFQTVPLTKLERITDHGSPGSLTCLIKAESVEVEETKPFSMLGYSDEDSSGPDDQTDPDYSSNYYTNRYTDSIHLIT